jgi:hypothetical protein
VDLDEVMGSVDKFTDENFPYQDALYWWDRGTEADGEVAAEEANIQWGRLFDVHDGWGKLTQTDGAKPSDVRMGNLEDAALLAGLAALAEYPERIERILMNNTELIS